MERGTSGRGNRGGGGACALFPRPLKCPDEPPQRHGFRFRRQYPAGPYTLDFYRPVVKIRVEIDGPLHDEAYDARRDAFLLSAGIRTLRFTSQEVYDDIEPVLGKILKACEGR